MPVQVELYGIPRARAGVERATAEGSCLGEVLADLAEQFPPLAESCIDGQRLRVGFTANLRGERFVADPNEALADGDTILLMTLDAGG